MVDEESQAFLDDLLPLQLGMNVQLDQCEASTFRQGCRGSTDRTNLGSGLVPARTLGACEWLLLCQGAGVVGQSAMADQSLADPQLQVQFELHVLKSPRYLQQYLPSLWSFQRSAWAQEQVWDQNGKPLDGKPTWPPVGFNLAGEPG